TSSAACLVGDRGDMTPQLERMFRSMGQQPPVTKRILELNPSHALVTRLKAAHHEHPDDPALAEAARVLYGMAVLAEGGDLADPAAFVATVSSRLESALP